MHRSISFGLGARLSAVGATIASCSAVLAADLPVKAAVYKAPVLIASDWSGF